MLRALRTVACLLALASCNGCSRTPLNEPGPTELPDPGGYVTNTEFPLELGSYHTCTVRIDNGLYCWGGNAMGQLGDGTDQPSALPVKVALPPGAITSLSLGFRHSCAALGGGDLYCWGENMSGQLGIPGAGFRVVSPARVPLPSLGLGGIIGLAAGEDHTCAVMSDGRLFCWGSNKQGQLGRKGPAGEGPSAVPLPGNARQVVAGDFHTCALVDAGGQTQAYCWGQNFFGQLGDGTTQDRALPVPAHLGLEPRALSARGFFTVALPASVDAQGRARLLGWGENLGGQLGANPDKVLTPQEFGPLWSIADFSAGLMHTCVVRWSESAPRTAYCWGTNGQGQLGDGTLTARTTPDAVAGLPEASRVRAGLLHSCAVAVDSSVWCWGTNDHGQLGDGTTAQRLKATRVKGF